MIRYDLNGAKVEGNMRTGHHIDPRKPTEGFSLRKE